MHCQHLSHYRHAQHEWMVASCVAKSSPYVPSLCDLENFCRSGRHALCPYYLAAGPDRRLFPGIRPAAARAGGGSDRAAAANSGMEM